MQRHDRATAALAIALTWVVLLAPASALDTVRKTSGQSVLGKVTAVSATEVTIEKAGGTPEKIPVIEIDQVLYDREPPEFRAARTNTASGAYANALRVLERVDVAKLERQELKQDLDFYRTYCRGKMALAGEGELSEASQELLAFVAAHPTSYHILPATELLGDVLVAFGDYAEARKHYAQLGQAPFPEYQVRSAVATGKALVAEGQYDQARAAFDQALQAAGKVPSDQLAEQRFAATLGKAACQAETGNPDEAVAAVEAVIAKLDPEQAELHAQAYVTLGKCYRKKPDATKEALLAFLHVHVLYSANALAHAEALAHLAELWTEDGKPERSVEMTQLLKERYPNTPWAKR